MVALALGCGATASTTSRGAAARPARATTATMPVCGLDTRPPAADISVVLAGTRVRVRLPHANRLVVGSGVPTIADACGLSVGVVSAPLHPAGGIYLDGALQGLLESARQSGARCGVSRDGTEWRCQDAVRANFIRRIVVPEGAALVSVMGPRRYAAALRSISRTAIYDPAEPYDPLAQLGISLAPPEGMAMTPTSSGASVEYREPDVAESPDAASIEWHYQLYATHPQHRDGSAWSSDELGEAVGRLASADMSALDMSANVIREGAVDEPIVALTTTGQRGAVPTLVYVRAHRESLGVFLAVARIPMAAVPMWLPRIEAHARSFRLVPALPGRDGVREALSGIQTEVLSCGGTGLATTAIFVRGANGRVERAVVVSGDLAGTAMAECVVRAALRAQFPRFRSPTFSVQFPFRL